MDYDVERSKQAAEEIRVAFRAMFPLAAEHDLPWAACQIQEFLRDRIRREVEEGVFHFQSRVVRVLCEISRPKTHVEDMARIVVDEAKKARELASQLESTKKQNEQLKEKLRNGATSRERKLVAAAERAEASTDVPLELRTELKEALTNYEP